MSSEQEQPLSEPAPESPRVTDPKAMRAIAHPVRMALLDLFSVTETLTATQASEALGESPANCAFHLRTLAKYGFLEEAGGGRGRERPWKAAGTSFSISTSTQETDQARIAAETLALAWADQWYARTREAVTRIEALPAAWQEAVGADLTITYLTADELQAVRAEVRKVLSRHLDRRYDPSRRPAGALPVEFADVAFPRMDLAGLGPESDANGPATESNTVPDNEP